MRRNEVGVVVAGLVAALGSQGLEQGGARLDEKLLADRAASRGSMMGM